MDLTSLLLTIVYELCRYIGMFWTKLGPDHKQPVVNHTSGVVWLHMTGRVRSHYSLKSSTACWRKWKGTIYDVRLGVCLRKTSADACSNLAAMGIPISVYWISNYWWLITTIFWYACGWFEYMWGPAMLPTLATISIESCYMMSMCDVVYIMRYDDCCSMRRDMKTVILWDG